MSRNIKSISNHSSELSPGVTLMAIFWQILTKYIFSTPNEIFITTQSEILINLFINTEKKKISIVKFMWITCS